MNKQHHTQPRPGPACASVAPLLALVVGQQDLDPQDAQTLQAHLETCASCRSELEEYRRLDGALARHFALPTTDPLSPAEISAILDQSYLPAAQSSARSLEPASKGTEHPLLPSAAPHRLHGHRFISSLSALAAAVLLVILVGSLVAGLILVRAHTNTAGHTPQPTATLAPSPTPTPESTPIEASGLASIQMFDAHTGWATTMQGHILRTTDGANHWQDVTPPAATQGGLPSFLNASVAWVVVEETTTAVLFKTADGGQTWQQAGTLTLSFPVDQLFFLNAQDGWALEKEGATGNEVADLYRTTDGGASWTRVSSTGNPPTQPGTIPFNGTAKSISFLNASTGWMAAFSNVASFWLYVTHDGGVTWQQQTLPMPPGVTQLQSEVRPPIFFTAHDGVLPVEVFAGGLNRLDAYITHDGGATWQSTALVQASDRTIDFIDAAHGWATDGTTLFSTSDGGQQWTQLPASSSFQNVMSLNFVSSTTGWALSQPSSGAPVLLKTTDGGQTWTV